MTTAANNNVVVETSGLIKACAWCVSRARLEELGRNFVVSHSLCTACAAKLEAGATA